MNFSEKDKRYLWHPFTQMQTWTDPLVIASADGNTLVDTEGRRYIDGISSLWVNVHGHRKAEIDQAVIDQLGRVAHSTLLGLSNVPAVELAEKLVAITPAGLEKVFYSDSGSTAVEVALKIAFQYQKQSGHTEKSKFLALTNAYHGDTIGSVSVGGMDLFHQIFSPLLFHVQHIEPSLQVLEQALRQRSHELAALIVEPLVQGAAGMLLQPDGFLRGARELCSRFDVLLICDEVATGFGRTGQMFACNHQGVSPDILCLAKGISGGYLPLAATLTTQKIYDAFLGAPAEQKTFFHGHSYTGNPLACNAALASLKIFEQEEVLKNLQPKIAHLHARLDTHIKPLAQVRQIRSCGFMVGVELTPPSWALDDIGARVCLALRKKGVILRPLGPVVVILPPLSITLAELDQIVTGLGETIVATFHDGDSILRR